MLLIWLCSRRDGDGRVVEVSGITQVLSSELFLKILVPVLFSLDNADTAARCFRHDEIV